MANIEEAVADLGTIDGAGPSDQVHVSAIDGAAPSDQVHVSATVPQK